MHAFRFDLKNRKFVIVGLLASLFLVFLAGSGQIASGLGLRAPDPGDDTSGGNYWYVVSRTPYVTINSTESKAYFNNNNNHSITIEHANICPSGSDENAGARGGGTTHTLYQVLRRDGTVVASGWGRHDFSGGCGSLTFNLSGGDFQPITTYEGTKYPFTIRASHQGAGNTQNGFKVRLDSGGVVGMKASGSRDSGIQRGGANNVYDNINIPTRTPCDVGSAIWSSINIYDPDNGVAGVQPERFRVRVLHNGNPLPASRYNPGSRWTGNAADGYMPGNQSNEDYSLGVRWLPNERYVIQLRHVYGNNTLQVGIPFDSAPFALDCRNAPTGTILSVDCRANAGQRIRITSNDRDGSTEARIRIGPAGSPNWTSSWVANGTRTIDVPPNAGGMNFTSGRWRIELYVRDKLSNGNFAAGSILVDTAQTERCDPPVVYERFVTLRPIVDQPPGIGIEPTESVRFNGRVNVSGYPTTTQWGYNEFARQNANNSGITANRETYSTNQGAQDSTASSNVAIERLCAGGAYRTTCTNYRCADGVARTSCGNYQWRCSWGGNTKYVTSGSQPACNIFGYYCRGSDGNWRTGSNYEYRNFNNRENANGCNNRWNCPNPSGTPNAYGPDSSVAPCLIFNCRNASDPQGFYESSGNGGGAADRRCDFRCNNGSGDHAPRATAGANNKYGEGDLRCYLRPFFDMQCRWDDPAIPPLTVRVNADGDYCPSFNDETGQEIGLSVCAAYSVRDPLTTGNWNPGSTRPWPGYGQDGSGNWRQLRDWGWIVGPQDEKCMRVVAKPTVKVNGGDIAVGGRFANACSISPTNASIVGWPHSPVFDASGTQYGAFASSEIFGFASATIRSNAQTQPASGLAFANTIASGDRYGGSFGPMPCIADHAGARPATAGNTGSLNSPGLDGSYDYPSPNINGTPTIRRGSQVVIYHTGNLHISSNILYERTGWLAPSDIPALKVVVSGGDITIDPAVTELNGIYVAQPNAAGVGGTIFTCASSGGPVAGVNMYAGCPNQLTVNGAFVAGQINFGRTTGTAIFGDTAEEFNYLPEVWLAQWPRDNTATNVKYDAMTNLPPIL